MFSKILRKFGIFTTILTSSILASCSSSVISKLENKNNSIVNIQLDNENKEQEEEHSDKNDTENFSSKVKKNIISDSLSSNSVWFDTKNIWLRIKNWWNSWGEPLFIGLFWLSGVAGIGIASYNIHLSNKRNFKLQNGKKLKITLELEPVSSISGGNWYGKYYNGGTSLEACCSCQRKLTQMNSSGDSSNNGPFSVSFILVNGPTKPGVLLYNLDGEDKSSSKEKYAANYITLKDYYPGTNSITIEGYKDGCSKNKMTIGKLTVKREIIENNNTANNSCECCKKDANSQTCKCICECKNKMMNSSTSNPACECIKKCECNNAQGTNTAACCCCCCILEEKKGIDSSTSNNNQVSHQSSSAICPKQENGQMESN